MSLLGHDDVIFIQVRWYHGLFLPASFFYCSETHKMALPYQARHSRIVRRSHEFQSLYHFQFWRSPGNFWTMERLGEWVWKILQVCALCFSVFWMNVLSLWSSVISSLPNCYFLGYWTASLKRNTEWSGQETTSRGRFYNNLVAFGLPNIIYLHTKSSQKFKSLSWTKIVKRYK